MPYKLQRHLLVLDPYPLDLQLTWTISDSTPLLYTLHYVCPVCGIQWATFGFEPPYPLVHRHRYTHLECVEHGNGFLLDEATLPEFIARTTLPPLLLAREVLVHTHAN